jgi:hypothetical protein
MSDPNYITDYEICGPRLDVDRLLPKVVRRRGCTVWRVGDVTKFGPEPASGLRLAVYEGDSITALERALMAFIVREGALLREARRLVGPVRGWDTQYSLSTAVFAVPREPPVGVTFSPELLRLAARARVTLGVVAWAWERKDAT